VAAFDNELVARLTATGMHAGTFLGVVPTGRRVRVSAFGAWQLQDGRCAEQWLQLDVLGLLQQLGAELTSSSTGR
jgi:predicted ester cyclase